MYILTQGQECSQVVFEVNSVFSLLLEKFKNLMAKVALMENVTYAFAKY